ncbi:tryptophanyl-tRNA synthetase [Cucurbitaria berberidis CBS 394.84]|uniref:Tryptophan--tRNA ligase, mitochondrial n=1 Tax=Cucurbitaria berberidis CBS 394.84 TaxID=1168544 RepID=A0A9P4LE68_9PLEO|nr:tryptophanyl-tRNA synthetase [Cucurbitaria berberidis CBS 394.84]KAF1851092.1 tryptophanyl-tRNA synthetase [Cucurbitaria berberidis CBS 394.84]
MFSLRTLHRAAPSSLRISSSCLRNYSVALPPREQPGKKQVIFSGIQPTGVPHLGNYLGALRQWVKLQDEASPDTTLLFSIVDLHAITIKQNPTQLALWRKEMLASLLAVGLDPKRCIIFAQSSVKQHAELMWILSCGASMGYLGRMTQWKSKLSLPSNASPLDPSPSNKDALKLGLFSYPVLQAADVLLYNTTHVPVGEDQAQHLEFSRELAIGFNHLYTPKSSSDPLLTIPQTLLSPAKRVMSLTDPAKKMSKSDPKPKSRILITDSGEEIHNKLKTALTDSIEGVSYDREMRPGVSNLVDLMFHFNQSVAASPEELANDMRDLSMRALKERVADTVDDGIKDIRERYEELMGGNHKELVGYAEDGASRAEEIAEETMKRVRGAIGIGW